MLTVVEEIRIVRADELHLLEQIRRIRRAVFIQEQGVPEEREYDRFEENSTYFLALHGSRPVGCIRYRPHSRKAKIERLAILKGYRMMGLGRKMMEHVEVSSRSKGLKGFILYSQVKVIPFYEKCGYEATGPVFLDAGIEHRRMIKE